MSTFNAANLSTSGGSQNPTVTITPSVVGNLLGLQIRLNSTTATITSVTDDRGNTWAAADTLLRNNACCGQLWYAIATSTLLTTVTVALSASVGNTLAIESIAPTLGGTPALAQHAVAGGNSASPNSGNIVTTATAILIGGVSLSPNADTQSWGGGFTIRTGSANRATIADRLDVVAGTYAASNSIAAEDWVCCIAAFTSAAAPLPPGLGTVVQMSTPMMMPPP